MKADSYSLQERILPSVRDLIEEIEWYIEDDPVSARILTDLKMYESYLVVASDKIEEEERSEIPDLSTHL